MQRSKNILIFLCLIILVSCDPPTAPINSHYAYVCGRDPTDHPIYRVNVPTGWKRKDLSHIKDKSDTKLPICEFDVDDIRITIHSFPSYSQNDRIPPIAQVERWKKQFQSLENFTTTPQAYSGYAGLLFEGTGRLTDGAKHVMGWSMQLASEHYRLIQDPQQKADFTIKAVGSVDAMNKRRKEIITFARSFELVEEIPEQL